jgi:CRISPR-associated protein Cas2
MYVVVTYDIPSDRRRSRLAKTLKLYLGRVQKSVFEGQIDAPTYARMKKRIVFELDQTVDSVRIYHICQRCRPNTEILGLGTYVPTPDDDEIL